MTSIQMQIEFIRNPDIWPIRDSLYMKKYIEGEKFPRFGMMVPGDDKTIYADDLKTVRAQYESTEKMMEDGWLVD